MKGIFKYSKLLEGVDNLEPVSMGEGGTPLVKSRQIGPALGLKNLYFKLENLNPTGSYKDRFASLVVSGLKDKKKKICLATSSGNTGAALAAYAARAGLPCHLAIVDGAPKDKLLQMQAYGSHLWMIEDFGIAEIKTKKVFNELAELARLLGTEVQVSAYAYSAFGMQGVQTIAYEIAEEIPQADHVFVPAGGGGLTLAVVRGFEKWNAKKRNFDAPKVHCVQPVGNDTMASAIRNKSAGARAIPVSTTAISGLQVPNIIDGDQVVVSCQKNGGNGYLVEDASVFNHHKNLTQMEGIFGEPAAAVSVAGLENALKSGEVDKNDVIVCLVTGHGFKDTGAAKNMVKDNAVRQIKEVSEIQLN